MGAVTFLLFEREGLMADVVMPDSIPCRFDAKGWAPCRKPSTNGLCSKHEGVKCVSCGAQAVRSCYAQMGGLGCGADLCETCQHGFEGGHVTGEVYEIQVQEEAEFRRTGKESARMLALRGVRTDVSLPRHLEELLKTSPKGFSLQLCYFLHLKHNLMGDFPAILQGTRIPVIATNRELMLRVWRSLDPRDSELVFAPWMVNEEFGVGYRMDSDPREQKHVVPHRVFSSAELEEYLSRKESPFAWAPGLFGASITAEAFERLIAAQEATAPSR